MTKKGHQKIWRMEIEKFVGKRHTESEKILKMGGNLKQREMHHGLRGNGRPCQCI